MTRVPVISTNLLSVGWQDNVLEIEFKRKHGVVYQYLGVNKRVYEDLLRAPSVGLYFEQCVRGRYPFKIGTYG